MIKLPNGDFWITNDTEEYGVIDEALVSDKHYHDNYKNLIDREYIEKNKLYNTDYQKFIETILDSYIKKDSHSITPRKLVKTKMVNQNHEEYLSGYWDANFDAYDEIFSQIGRKVLKYCKGDVTVYESPWGTVYVRWLAAPDGYDSEISFMKFDNWSKWQEYLEKGE